MLDKIPYSSRLEFMNIIKSGKISEYYLDIINSGFETKTILIIKTIIETYFSSNIKDQS